MNNTVICFLQTIFSPLSEIVATLTLGTTMLIMETVDKIRKPKDRHSEEYIEKMRLTLKEQQEHNKVLAKLINEMQVEISTLRAFREAAEQYGDSVPIDDLREMLNRIDDPEKAQLLFMNLDFHLRNNPKWKRHSDELAGLIHAKFDAQRKRNQRLFEAATKPTTVTNNFYKDSCNFGAGSSMFGNVHMKEKSNNQKDKTKESDE